MAGHLADHMAGHNIMAGWLGHMAVQKAGHMAGQMAVHMAGHMAGHIRLAVWPAAPWCFLGLGSRLSITNQRR